MAIMKINYQDIKALYPSASMQRMNTGNQNNIYLPTNEGIITLPKNSLTEREEKLFSLFIKHHSLNLDIEKHPWYSYLFEGRKIDKSGNFRILQVKLNYTQFPLKQLWQDEIQTIFLHMVDFFFLNENFVIIVEKESDIYLDKTELEGVFLALDTDFDVTTQLFVGSFQIANEEFKNFFLEEQKIFSSCSLNQKCQDITTAIIDVYSDIPIKKSRLLSNLFHKWIKESELRKIIPILWRNLGNISLTSKDLFMHRNTLLYKIEKFYTETGINLKEADSLFLCHLLIRNFDNT
ncbi:helix-turn-helix domain-containing protein [Enterococcus dongliensis]|uniref:Helix-turn-helix domain-containing protein n=1 Tax=Enterococcus dongliensis TaxID=2559925 RepID=A0AAP5NJ06_9ENTE|nr:helix-turn-helix domain-containing protein [Enterococcus dongliensis]MDT2596648.1 helix-turn-helix domain-containing protein [Enterococcus dongliensis]MDT2604175.1 helix-turn-helix domain-containing protein [Enterococcus dongliensis]MDT2634633.1 helix-turn-helix domain-containing protein [Enterococcus dongliensis]MDT2637543.1 helix-turn-helix domain-containing protein [Enterococcus dongliensis]MDT2642651.1 helix-turn-helix domain-containing protein [Enterococcus dongliensis]